jgi:N-acetylmuramoyl-L-alanine amidase
MAYKSSFSLISFKERGEHVMKKFLLNYGYLFCLLIIVIILIINYMVLISNIKRETALSCIGTYSGQITMVLDAGHGGEDGGAVSLNGTLEKDLNLAITLKT